MFTFFRGLTGFLLSVGLSAGPAMGALQFTPVALTGQPAPGAPAGVTYSGFEAEIWFNPSGLAVFSAGLQGQGVDPRNSFGIWGGPATNVQKIARAGDPYPSVPALTLSTVFFPSPMSRSGEVGFLAGLRGPDINPENWTVFMAGKVNQLKVIARHGDQPPGLPEGSKYTDLNSSFPCLGVCDPYYNATGDRLRFAFTGLAISPLGVLQSIWAGSTENVDLIYAEGYSGESVGVARWAGIGPNDIFVNGSGEVALRAIVRTQNQGGGPTTGGIWSGLPSQFQNVVLGGQPAPGLPAGTIFRGGFERVYLNDQGTVFFLAYTGISGGQTPQSFWFGRPGELTLVANEGQHAPMLADGVIFKSLSSSFYSRPLNAAGQAVFTATLEGPGIAAPLDKSLWLTDESGIRPILTPFDVVPGTNDGSRFAGSDFYTLTNSGRLMIAAKLSGPAVTEANNSAILSGPADDLKLIAREGSAAPGAGELVFGPLGGSAINDRGILAFVADLVGMGVDLTNDTGLWGATAEGELLLLVREGDLFPVAPDDLRRVKSIRLAGYSINRQFQDDPGLYALDESGQVLFRLEFVDGSEGIFVAMIPEPGGLALLGISGLWCCKRRNRTIG
jgi:hypothetical protein